MSGKRAKRRRRERARQRRHEQRQVVERVERVFADTGHTSPFADFEANDGALHFASDEDEDAAQAS